MPDMGGLGRLKPSIYQYIDATPTILPRILQSYVLNNRVYLKNNIN
jgi:hypothetical protein